MLLAPGQRWTYRAPPGFEASRIVIGALATCETAGRIVCFSVSGAPYRWPDGRVEAVSIPFIPLTEAAFLATVVALDGSADPDEGFAEAVSAWTTDTRGLTVFTVAYDGMLDVLIARQMAALTDPAIPAA
ncbi:MAG: hypothetical protein NW217_09070 [Hyphomicrobiaceae bacterium]|nr:hypothetical protein [Hyphomicrobiaceae bacterium]